MKTLQKILALGICALFLTTALADRPIINFDIHAQPLDRALTTFARQSGLQIAFYPATIADGMYSRDLRGSLTPVVALKQLLEDTDLKYEFVNERTIKITRKSTTTSDLRSLSPRFAEVTIDDTLNEHHQSKEKIRLAESAQPSSYHKVADAKRRPDESTIGGIPEILVKDSRILNMDIRRTRDDSQPYVVFDRETIEKSGAVNLDDFFKQRLPMNMQFTFANQSALSDGNRSSINLRGLGTSQTLILIDGHRTADLALSGVPNQYDINGIPLSAIERIEILPTTASAIYGGSATGGVVNLILRRDYQGIDTKLVYDNVFGAEAGRRRVDMGAGFAIEDGKTSILLVGSYEDANSLTNGERSFTGKYLAESYAVGPAQYLPPNNLPPVGGTTNIRSSDGSLLQLDSGTVLSSSFTSVPVGYGGPGSDAGVQLAARAGQYNLAQANSAQTNGLGFSLLPETEVKSLTATINRDFNRFIRGFVEAGLSENQSGAPANGVGNFFSLAATDPGNPFQQAIWVAAPSNTADSTTETTISNRRVVGGMIVGLPKAWTGEIDFTWNKTKYQSRTPLSIIAAGSAAVSSGVLNIFRDTDLFPPDYSPYLVPALSISPQKTSLKDTTLRLAGPVGTLPAGAPQLSLLLETRKGVQGEGTSYFGTSNFTQFYPERSQSVDSAYGEVRFPLISSKNQVPAIQELGLQVSGRHDRYKTLGVTSAVSWIGTPDSPPATFPTILRAENEVRSTDFMGSVSWRPIKDIEFRSSYGTGFLPPSVNQLITSVSINSLAGLALTDPLRGNTLVTAGNRLTGGNPNLEPEESESFSAGFILTPRFVPSLRLSVDYVKINKTNNIANFPGGEQAILNATASGQYLERVVRSAPSGADIAAGWAGPITQLDATLFNVARAKVEAFDAQLDYQLNTPFGGFDFFLLGTYQPHYRTQTAINQPELERAGFFSGALKWKANAGVNWRQGPWSLAWNTRYFDSYIMYPAGTTEPGLSISYLIPQGGNSTIPSQIYHDVNGSYRLGEHLRSGWMSDVLSDAEVQLGVRNIFNKEPPRYRQGYSSFGDPRLASYWISFAAKFGGE